MSGVPLPEDGPAEVAGVSLPDGQRVYGWDDDVTDIERPLARVTSRPMADAGYAWLALSAAHPETGLVPMLLSRADGMEDVSGYAFGFYGAQDVRLIDAKSAEMILAAGWDTGEDVLDDYLAENRAPFGLEFPGLAPAEETRLPEARLRMAVATEQPAFLGLVAAERPADVPAAVGWTGFGIDMPAGPEARSLEIAAVLRSWETRFGARPLRIGSDMILRVLVERPPSTFEAAIRVAAEHLAFADEYGRYSGQPVSELAAELVNQPIWHFWWD
jgi:Domain of unknown function (DUF4253)